MASLLVLTAGHESMSFTCSCRLFEQCVMEVRQWFRRLSNFNVVFQNRHPSMGDWVMYVFSVSRSLRCVGPISKNVPVVLPKLLLFMVVLWHQVSFAV